MSEIKYLLGDEELFFAVYKISAEFRQGRESAPFPCEVGLFDGLTYGIVRSCHYWLLALIGFFELRVRWKKKIFATFFTLTFDYTASKDYAENTDLKSGPLKKTAERLVSLIHLLRALSSKGDLTHTWRSALCPHPARDFDHNDHNARAIRVGDHKP